MSNALQVSKHGRSLQSEKENPKAPDRVDTSSTPSLQAQDTEALPQPKLPGSETPDGGLAAWVVALGAWCTSFCSFGWLNSTAGFYLYISGIYLTSSIRYRGFPRALPKRTA